MILRLTSKQASRGLPNRAIKQAEGCFACLLAYQQVWIQERRIHVGLLKYHFFRDRKPKKERNTGELRVVHSYEAMFRRGSIGRLVFQQATVNKFTAEFRLLAAPHVIGS